MYGELIEKKRWISMEDFLHALSHCMILHGVDRQRLLEGGPGLALITRYQELESCKPMLDK